jgi:hypothetical protein
VAQVANHHVIELADHHVVELVDNTFQLHLNDAIKDGGLIYDKSC